MKHTSYISVMTVLVIGFLLGCSLGGCASSTVIRSVPSGAKVFIDGEIKGETPYSHTDKKISFTTIQVLLKKKGYKEKTVAIQRSDGFSVGTCIGGVFLLLIPWLWVMEYDPEYIFELNEEDGTPAAIQTTIVRPAEKKEPPPEVASRCTKVEPGTVVAAFDVEDDAEVFNRKILVQLTDYLMIQMGEQGGYRFVPRKDLLKKISEKKKKSYGSSFSKKGQIELGKALAAQKILRTKIMRVGDVCAVSSTLYDLTTEATDKAASVESACSVGELMQVMKKLARKLSCR